MPQETIAIAELLTALSLATDLANDQPFESAVRTTLIATRIADAAGASPEEATDVYYAALLRFVGCTSYSHEGADLFDGDDIEFHRAFAALDPRRPRELFALARSRAGEGGPARRAREMVSFLSELPSALPAFAASSCEVATRLTERLGMSIGVTKALSHTYERWDGRGKTRALAGENISWPARVVQVARMTELLTRQLGPEAGLAALAARAGAQLDPALVTTALELAHSATLIGESSETWSAVRGFAARAVFVPDAGLDEVAGAFADFVDLKSVYTLGHSHAVSRLAEGAARALGMGDEEAIRLRHAGLLHDLGRVAVPTGIWEKPGPLSVTERERVRLHPYYSERIMASSPLLAPIAAIAGAHHERLDGSGYHRNAPSSILSRAARVLAAADVYQALTERRPYRDALAAGDAAATLEAEAAAGRLDREAVVAVLDAAGHERRATPSSLPAGLSGREVEVLRWVAQGRTNKETATILSISPRTVQHHVQHIYDKIGVSTRAGAALFAIEHRLLPA